MSNALNYSMRELNDCGCCEGLTAQTPLTLGNRSGLNAIAYRVGNHARFKQTMLARLSASEFTALAGLRTRDEYDFTIALLDAWATVADVLTFYQERIANESYLRTATERRSLLELARSVGYELRPGIAASTYLAFTLEESPGAPDLATKKTTISIGSKVQSTPGPDEQAQLYETIEQIEARVEHNAIRPRLRLPQVVTTESRNVLLKGTTNDIKPGDRLLIVGGANKTIKTVHRVSVDFEDQTTRVDFVGPSIFEIIDPFLITQQKAGLSFLTKVNPTALITSGKMINKKLVLDPSVLKEEILNKDWNQADLKLLIKLQKWPEASFVSVIKNLQKQLPLPSEAKVYVFRQRASVFGYNAQKKVINYDPAKNQEWAPASDEGRDKIFLDRVYDKVVPGSYVAVSSPGKSHAIFRINQVEAVTRTAYGISGQTTRLTLPSGESWWSPFI